MKGNSGFQIGTGVTSIFMIFVVLCLTTFSILSYTSADADLQLNKKNSSNIQNYYDAYSKLNVELSKIDAATSRWLKEELENGQQNGLQKIVISLGMRETGDVVANYQLDGKAINVKLVTDMNDKQQLVLEATINTEILSSSCVVNRCYVYTENESFTQEETLPDMWGG